mmetsp:Transcript_21542/g.52432  ORF Transcript_21542/g.52432 Transcript_21542/m.52432 type:complete len:316 (+) Transcript_21542:88-1035(+)
MSDSVTFRGVLEGHLDWVTSIATSFENPNTIVTGSRDKSVMVWELSDDAEVPGMAKRRLTGHNGPVSDVVISSDGQFCMSASWDTTLRLWDIGTGNTVRKFTGHTKDVFAVAFSADNRQIVSGSRDRTIKLWNTLAECKYTITEDMHSDWVSTVRFSPSAKTPLIVSTGWDKLVKVWNLTSCKLKTNLAGHQGPIYDVAISPDGSLCASGGKDATAMLWDVNDGKHLYSLDGGSTINGLVFSPKNYWLVAACDNGIKVWDLETKAVLEEITPQTAGKEPRKDGLPFFSSVNWTSDGTGLFAGGTDGKVYVFELSA